MRLLSLAFRGIWSRRATSLMLLVVAVLTTTAAAAAPSYADSARDAVLQSALRTAPIGASGTGIEVTAEQTGKPSVAGVRGAIDDAFTGAARRAYPTEVTRLSVVQRLASPVASAIRQIELIARDGICDHVRMIAGSCLSEADPTGLMISSTTAAALKLRVGDHLAVTQLRGGTTPVAMRVRGIAEAVAAPSFWSGSASASDTAPTPDTLPTWVPQAYFATLTAEAGDGVVATAELALDRSTVHVTSIDTVSSAIDNAARRVQASGRVHPSVSTGLQVVLDRGLKGGERLTLPIVVTVAELLALGWYLLHTLIGAAVEARGAEVALSKVRGLTSGRTLLFTLLEPAMLLAASVPFGVLLAGVAENALAPVALGATADIRLTWTSWAAAIAAAAGGLVAAAAASVAVFRRSVLEQWRRTAPSASRRGAVVDVVVVVLAIAGVVQLRLSGALGAGSANGIAVLAPMLLVVAGALIGSRIVVLIARLGFRPTRGTGAVAAFVGMRQVARRPAGRRTFGVLVVALAMAMYGLSSAAVLAQNRDERALTDVGAPTVLHIRSDVRTEQRIRALGLQHEVAAVTQAPTQVSGTSGLLSDGAARDSSPSLLVVDPGSFGSVAYWRADFGSTSLGTLLHPLASRAPISPSVSGTSIAFDITASSVARHLSLGADLTDALGRAVAANLGEVTEGRRTYTAPVPACAGGCQLRRIYLSRPADDLSALTVGLTVHGVSTPGGAASPSLSAARWTPLNPTPDAQIDPAESIQTEGNGIRITISVSGSPGDSVPGFGAVAGAPTSVPALISQALIGTSTNVSASTSDGTMFPLTPSGHVSVLPRSGNTGVIVARDWAIAASPSGYAQLLPDQLWIAADAPAGIVDRLRHAGVRVLSIERAVDRSAQLASEGPAFATALTVAGGATAVLLAIAATVLGLGLLARRRIFELSALRTLGIRSRALLGSVLIEQALLIVAATTCGLGLALASVQLALPALPAYVDDPAYPAFQVDQPVVLLLCASAGATVLLLLAVLITAGVLTRSASVSRLREAEQ